MSIEISADPEKTPENKFCDILKFREIRLIFQTVHMKYQAVFVIVVFPDHTHLLFWLEKKKLSLQIFWVFYLLFIY